MLHTYTINPDELIKIEKRKYAVLKTDPLRVEGDEIVFTLANTRTQLQAVITDVNTVFTSKQVLALDNIQITGVESFDDIPGTVGGGEKLRECE